MSTAFDTFTPVASYAIVDETEGTVLTHVTATSIIDAARRWVAGLEPGYDYDYVTIDEDLVELHWTEDTDWRDSTTRYVAQAI